MKMFLKLLMAVVVLAVAAPFYLKDDKGAALLSFNDLKMPNLGMPEIPDSVQSVVSEISPGELGDSQTAANDKTKIKIHKWQDENGAWHFSSSDDSKEGEKSEVVTITLNDKNRYKSLPPPKSPTKESPNSFDVDNVTASPLLPFTHGKQTMDQAKQIQAMLEQRQKMQQQMMP